MNRSSLLRSFGTTCFLALVLLSTGACTLLEVSRLNSRDLTEFSVEGERLYMTREINSRTLDQFNAVIESHPKITTLVLTVVPGSVDDEINLQLGKRVRELGLNTHLVSGGMIASGGVDLFLAGARRTLESGSYVGVHSWGAGFGKTGNEVPRDDPQHRLYLDYYLAIDIAEDFYWFTLEAAPAGEMHWMTLDEVERFSMITSPPVEGTSDPGPFADQIAELRDEIEISESEDRPIAFDAPR